MRILGFSKMWDKLKQPEFTTFRFARKDKDWCEGEMVQVVYKPRSKERKILGTARIIDRNARRLTTNIELGTLTTQEEAIADGFAGLVTMFSWMLETHGDRILREPINKLTLQWIG